MSIRDAWFDAFSNYYPMTLAMVVGCFIAGSTPLGGAVTAFPVAVLVLKFTPAMGRDFSALIQSVGMSAAAYLIIVRKKHMVNPYFVQFGCVSSAFGIVIGSSVELPGFWINVIYMTYTLSAAFLLLYKHTTMRIAVVSNAESEAQSQAMQKAIAEVKIEGENLARIGKDLYQTARYQDPITLGNTNHERANSSIVEKTHTETEHEDQRKPDEWYEPEVPAILRFGLVVTGLLGGTLTSKIGSGSDTLLYMYGVFVHNALMPVGMPESVLTATSVIVMAFSSIVLSIIRLIEGDIARDVYLCWGAVLWLVVVGAPIGSLVLNKQREAFFRRLFYMLAVIQFATFALLKIKTRVEAWIVVGSILLLTIVGMVAHAYSAIFLRCLCGLNASGEQEPDEKNTSI